MVSNRILGTLEPTVPLTYIQEKEWYNSLKAKSNTILQLVSVYA